MGSFLLFELIRTGKVDRVFPSILCLRGVGYQSPQMVFHGLLWRAKRQLGFLTEQSKGSLRVNTGLFFSHFWELVVDPERLDLESTVDLGAQENLSWCRKGAYLPKFSLCHFR